MAKEHDAEKSTTAIIDLLLELDWYEWDPRLYYHRLLEVVLSIIPEASSGTVSIRNPERWEFVASIGHEMPKLLSLQLDPRWWVPSHGVRLVGSLLECLSLATPHESQRALQECFAPVGKTLVGAYQLDNDEEIILTVESTNKKDNKSFAPSHIRTFEAFLKLAGKYQSITLQKMALENVHESLVCSYEEISTLSTKIRELLSLSQQFGDSSVKLSMFFKQLLLVLFKLVDGIDYGSIALIKGERISFISARGHRLKELNQRYLKKQWFLLEEQKTMLEIQHLHQIWKVKMPPEVYTEIQRVFLPTESTLMLTVPVDNRISLLFMLDIAAGKKGRFTNLTKRMCLSFAELARGFVSLRVQAELTQHAYYTFSQKLARVVEQYDPETGAHNYRVSLLSEYLARKMGLSPKRCEEIGRYAGLHDIGKIFIDSVILRKEGPLTAQEFDAVKQHTTFSQELLEGSFFEVARNIAMYHHERWDGKGYPLGLRGNQIPIEAQIVALADVYDALRSTRVYKRPYTKEEALRILIEGDERDLRGQFNPHLLKIFLDHIEEIECTIYKHYPEGAAF